MTGRLGESHAPLCETNHGRRSAGAFGARRRKNSDWGPNYSSLIWLESQQPPRAFGGGMTHWTASVVAILLAGFPASRARRWIAARYPADRRAPIATSA